MTNRVCMEEQSCDHIINTTFTHTNHEEHRGERPCKLQHMPKTKLLVNQPAGDIHHLVVEDIQHATTSVAEQEHSCGIHHCPSGTQVDTGEELGL